jgi:hypothetical protein
MAEPHSPSKGAIRRKIVLYTVRDGKTGEPPVWFDDREAAFGWWLALGVAGVDAWVGQVEVDPTAAELCALLAGHFDEETIASAERRK